MMTEKEEAGTAASPFQLPHHVVGLVDGRPEAQTAQEILHVLGGVQFSEGYALDLDQLSRNFDSSFLKIHFYCLPIS